MVELYVCQICGESYLGGSVDDCPFCGAPKNYMKSFDEFSVLWGIEMNESEKKDMEATLALEVNAAAYYQDVSERSEKYSKQNRLFKVLAAIEKEHAEVAAKFLGVEIPELKGEVSRGSVEADLVRTKTLEEEAIEKYQGFLKNAVNINVKNFYVALIHAEKGHLNIAEKESGK